MARQIDSPLVKQAVWNNNYWIRGTKPTKIFIHHMVANGWTSKRCGEYFKGAGVSSNYGIGFRGDMCQYVEEKYGAKAQGNLAYNKNGISIEIANSTGAPNWKVSDESIESCIELVADILIRNKMGRAKYTGDLSGNICMHKWVAQTSCPGKYLGGKFPHIANECNKIIDGKLRVPERGYFTKGDYGRSVRNLKKWLKKRGFYKGISLNRTYSTAMVKAVKRFQKKYGLVQDGEFGAESMNVLRTLK